MDDVNMKQIGGDHYKTEYQHWDFVADTWQHYLQGCATKYISRWTKKNGKEDLQKAVHYIEKLLETRPSPNGSRARLCSAEGAITRKLIKYFCISNQLIAWEELIITKLLEGEFKEALDELNAYIETIKEEKDGDPTGQEHPFGFDAKGEAV